MVLQRGRPNSFWGWAAPGHQVTVQIEGKKASGVAGADGKWVVKLQPPGVGGPYTVSIDGGQHVQLTDVLVGDVWLCTGQSNMEMGITLENGASAEIAAAEDVNLRLFMADRTPAMEPAKTNGGTWKRCTPTTVAEGGWGGFSAVGYSFGKALRRETGVPIGLVEVVWGGTNAESWTSREGLLPLGDFNEWFPMIDASKGKSEEDQGEKLGWAAADFDDGAWKTTTVPDGFGGLGLDNFDGTAWFRKRIELTAEQAANVATISLGAVDDFDTTWINGAQVGGGGGWDRPRAYAVPAGQLKAGSNSLVVRVVDTGNGGGFVSGADQICLVMKDGSKIPLAGAWKGTKGAQLPLNGNNVPTSLYNGMIAPLLPLSIKGAIWYQGENNANRAEQYRRLLPAMIADWRTRFGQGDFPFYIVSLASFMTRKPQPGDDAWAELREAQAMTATKVKNSGLAIAIDIGDAADIHPKEKKTVGERLARIALARDYGKKVEYLGPTYKSMKVEGSSVRVKFDHANGLTSTEGAPGEFALAGSDHKWHAATARIEGDAVVVTAAGVSAPVAVRYAWQANPKANLVNKAGLPAVPFRSDDWPGVTHGRK